MDYRVLKYNLFVQEGSIYEEVPDGAIFLHAAPPASGDRDYMQVWFEVPDPYEWTHGNPDKDYLKIPREFRMYDTGQKQTHNRDELTHLATVTYPGRVVCHLYGDKWLVREKEER